MEEILFFEIYEKLGVGKYASAIHDAFEERCSSLLDGFTKVKKTLYWNAVKNLFLCLVIECLPYLIMIWNWAPVMKIERHYIVSRIDLAGICRAIYVYVV